MAATIDATGRPVVLRNPMGAELVPSVVSFAPGGAVVGDEARQLAAIAPELTVALVKRQMGTGRRFEFHGVEHTPESISSLILRAVVDGVAPDRPPTGLPVVVTVPAYFGIREREATQQAALLAGLEVLELIGEPVAAALHHGATGPGTLVVYDLGGGTFDATVLRSDSGGPQIVAVDGDMDLGGADWDARLHSHLADRFVELTGADEALDDAAFMTGLTATAERTKRALTGTQAHEVVLRHDGRTARITVTRAEFESMTRDLTASTVDCVRRMLAQTGLAPGDVTGYLLVGGSTRMPMVAEAIEAELGLRPRRHEPELAVAKGAALRAAALTRTGPAWVTPGWGFEAATPGPATSGSESEPARTPFLSSVVPRSFGLLIHDSADPDGQRRYVQHVIHQNDPLPGDRGITVATVLDDQATVRIEVFEQAGFVESPEFADNQRVLDGEFTGLPAGLPAGSPLEVRLSLGLDGRLSLTAREPRSATELRLEAYVDGVLDSAARGQQAASLAALTVRQ
ncbi:Hsp70 family protein [Actinoplanes bogorensis]|uniref:Hsp70 family protein n=1 Tax=Paractinoplanes bogorensis TaxID=1610840 RepID=A0ABS5YXR2_9ACTN|nr:Hsp70 family protein [Actinoplanes bogorensis]